MIPTTIERTDLENRIVQFSHGMPAGVGHCRPEAQARAFSCRYPNDRLRGSPPHERYETFADPNSHHNRNYITNVLRSVTVLTCQVMVRPLVGSP